MIFLKYLVDVGPLKKLSSIVVWVNKEQFVGSINFLSRHLSECFSSCSARSDETCEGPSFILDSGEDVTKSIKALSHFLLEEMIS